MRVGIIGVVLGLLLPPALSSADPLTFTFVNVALSDGGTWEGWARVHDDGTRDWLVTASGGDTAMFPEITYSPLNSVWVPPFEKYGVFLSMPLIRPDGEPGTRFLAAIFSYRLWISTPDDIVVELGRARFGSQSPEFYPGSRPFFGQGRTATGGVAVSGDRTLSAYVPEPTAGALLLVGLGGRQLMRRHRRKAGVRGSA